MTDGLTVSETKRRLRAREYDYAYHTSDGCGTFTAYAISWGSTNPWVDEEAEGSTAKAARLHLVEYVESLPPHPTQTPKEGAS